MSRDGLLRNDPKYNVLVFHALCGMMANFMESNQLPKQIDKHTIKFLSKQLFEALQKPVNDMLLQIKIEGIKEGDEALQQGITEDVDIPEVLHISAIAMEHFFRLSLQITDLPEVRKNTLFTQLNSLLISYGLETMDISIFD